MPTTLLVNPAAGKGRAQGLLAEISGLLRDELGDDVVILMSRSYVEAEQMAAQAVADGGPLVVMGGDGMMHLGINACAESPVTLGMIPAGTGDDLCRGMGLDARNPMAAARHITSTDTRKVDLLRVTSPARERFVGTIVATGFDSQVNRRANTMAWPRGSMRYSIATAAELRTFQPLHYRLEVDGVPRELDAMLVAVGNTETYGGGMPMCLGADPTDGLLDLTIIHAVGRAELLRLLPKLRAGKLFQSHPAVEQLRAREVVVDGVSPQRSKPLRGMGDGEPLGATPLTIRIVPDALTIFAHSVA